MPFLLEKLAEPVELGQTPQFNLRQAVAAQIQRLVSARVVENGNDLNLLELGNASVVELGIHDKAQMARYSARMQRLIARYEPRLLAPKVRLAASGNPLSPLQLVVSGTLSEDDEADVFYFELPLH